MLFDSGDETMALGCFPGCRVLTGACAAWLLIAWLTLARATDIAWAPAETGHLTIEPAPPGRLPWVVFDERSGLPQHTIVDLLTDQHGFVWAATQDGTARYNGRTCETIPFLGSSRFPCNK